MATRATILAEIQNYNVLNVETDRDAIMQTYIDGRNDAGMTKNELYQAFADQGIDIVDTDTFLGRLGTEDLTVTANSEALALAEAQANASASASASARSEAISTITQAEDAEADRVEANANASARSDAIATITQAEAAEADRVETEAQANANASARSDAIATITQAEAAEAEADNYDDREARREARLPIDIVPGDATPEEIEALQLKILEIDPDALPRFGADKDFGNETEGAAIAIMDRLIPDQTGGTMTIAQATAFLDQALEVQNAQLAAQHLEEANTFITENRPETIPQDALGSAAGARNDTVLYLQKLVNENGGNIGTDGLLGNQTRGALYDALGVPEDVDIDDIRMTDLVAAMEAELKGETYTHGFHLADGSSIQSPTANTAADALLAKAHADAADMQDGQAEDTIRLAQDRAEQIRGLDVTKAKDGEGLILIAKRTMPDAIQARADELLNTEGFRENYECPEDTAYDMAALEAANTIAAVNPHQNWTVGNNGNDVKLGEPVVIPETLDPNAPTLDWNTLHIEGVSQTTCEANSSCPVEEGITPEFTAVTPIVSPVQVNDDCLAYYERDPISGNHGWRIDGETPATDAEVREAVGDPNARVWQSCEAPSREMREPETKTPSLPEPEMKTPSLL